MAAALQIQGSRESGQDVRGQNVTAVAAIANIVKSSLGPVGLDKVCLPSQQKQQADVDKGSRQGTCIYADAGR